MNQSKILNIILFILALIIWVMVFRSIYSGSERENSPINDRQPELSSSGSPIPFSDTLIPFQKDPFYPVSRSIKETEHAKTAKKPATPHIPFVFPYQLQPIGKMKENNGIMLLLDVNGNEYIVRKNDTINDFIILDISDTLLIVLYRSKIFKFGIP